MYSFDGRWSHKQFDDAVRRRYFVDEATVAHFYAHLSDYYLGTWSGGRAKPYTFTQQQRANLGLVGRSGEADRKVAAQPLVYLDKEGHLSRLELETKVIRRFPMISQSRRRLLLGPSPA